jgi:signal transduction histidine kinase
VGREGHRPGAIPLLAVVDTVIDEFALAIRARGIEVTHPAPLTLWGTQTHVEQVFRNLIGNAVKFVGNTAGPAIDVTAVDRGSMVECAVRDNGIGIDPVYHPKLFEIFYRLEDSGPEGTGVGLALVKKIVEFNGGRVWVESVKGEGATFRFTWPKAPP